MNTMMELGMAALVVLMIGVGLVLKAVGSAVRFVGINAHVGQGTWERADPSGRGKVGLAHDLCVDSADAYLAKRSIARAEKERISYIAEAKKRTAAVGYGKMVPAPVLDSTGAAIAY